MSTNDSGLAQIIERSHYEFQVGMYFSEARELEVARLFYSDLIEDSFWNYAADISTTSEGIGQLIETTEVFYSARDRAPAFYIVPWTQPEELQDELKRQGYEGLFEDAWVAGQNLSVPQMYELPKGVEITTVQTPDQIDAFVDTFMAAFGYVSEEVPYGGLPPSYGEALKRAAERGFYDRVMVNYLATSDGKPAGVASLVYAEGIAGLYNLGVSPEYRRRGIGRALAIRRIADALHAGNETIFFQTEPGGIVEKMYHRLGFRTEFLGVCLAKT